MASGTTIHFVNVKYQPNQSSFSWYLVKSKEVEIDNGSQDST